MDYKSLGMRIRRQRKSLRLTQDELAERANISLSFLGHIERGSRKASIETLVALANALSISTDSLLQESLNDNVLANRPTEKQDSDKLLEAHKLLTDTLASWGDL